MNIQHKIKIGRYEIETILVDDETILEIHQEDEPDANYPPEGLYRMRDAKIFVNQDQCEEQRYSSWLHEVIEAGNFLRHIKLEHDQIIQLEGLLFDLGVTIQGVEDAK